MICKEVRVTLRAEKARKEGRTPRKDGRGESKHFMTFASIAKLIFYQQKLQIHQAGDKVLGYVLLYGSLGACLSVSKKSQTTEH